jgi:hypothetical protein
VISAEVLIADLDDLHQPLLHLLQLLRVTRLELLLLGRRRSRGRSRILLRTRGEGSVLQDFLLDLQLRLAMHLNRLRICFGCFFYALCN